MLSPLATALRRNDPDRFLTALFAPAEKREMLFLLYAFDRELARAHAVASDPTIALIRLQWWREVVEGASRRHELATPLATALADGVFDRADLLGMIEGREAAEPVLATVQEWQSCLLAGEGGTAVAAGRLLGASGDALEALRLLGAAYGAARLLREASTGTHRGTALLPEEMLTPLGLSPEGLSGNTATLQPALARLTVITRGWLHEGRRRCLPRPVLAAGLPAVLARRDLRRIGQPLAPRGLGDRLAVTSAALRGAV